MNTNVADAAAGDRLKSTTAPAAIGPVRTLQTLVRREFWEHPGLARAARRSPAACWCAVLLIAIFVRLRRPRDRQRRAPRDCGPLRSGRRHEGSRCLPCRSGYSRCRSTSSRVSSRPSTCSTACTPSARTAASSSGSRCRYPTGSRLPRKPRGARRRAAHPLRHGDRLRAAMRRHLAAAGPRRVRRPRSLRGTRSSGCAPSSLLFLVPVLAILWYAPIAATFLVVSAWVRRRPGRLGHRAAHLRADRRGDLLFDRRDAALPLHFVDYRLSRDLGRPRTASDQVSLSATTRSARSTRCLTSSTGPVPSRT